MPNLSVSLRDPCEILTKAQILGERPKLKHVPADALKIVFDFLGKKETGTICAISKACCQIKFDQSRNQQNDLMGKLENFVITELKDRHVDDILLAECENIFKCAGILKAEKSMDIRASLYITKQKMVKFLSEHQNTILTAIENYATANSTPTYFNDPEKYIPDSDITSLSAKFLERMDYTKAYEVALVIKDGSIQAKALCDVAHVLIDNGELQQALTIAVTIKSDTYQSITLRNIAMAFMKRGDVDKALQVTSMISELGHKCSALGEIALILIVQGKLSTAMAVVDKISLGEYKDKALLEIISELTKQDEAAEALKIAYTLSKFHEGLKNIIDVLIEQEKFDRAIEIANLSTWNTVKSTTLSTVSEKLLLRGDFKKAAEVAKMHTGDTARSKALKEIVDTLIGHGDLEPARQVAYMIRADEDSDYYTRSVINGLQRQALRSIEEAHVKKTKLRK